MIGEVDIGHGIVVAPMRDEVGTGLYWRHPGCRPCFYLWFRPDPRSTGHALVTGCSIDDLATISIIGSLACPKGCPVHGTITNGRWDPA